MDWVESDGRDITAAFKGITTPLAELYNEIHIRGWDVKDVSFKDGAYVCKVANPHGEQVERKGNTPNTAVGQALLFIVRREHIRGSRRLGMWGTTWTDKLAQIAQAYSKAPIFDQKAAGAWKELADDSVARFKVLQQQLHIEVVDDPEPYHSSQEMCEDVHKNRHFFVSRANSEHPVWTQDQNVAFRTVHDVMGHCVAGGDFGWQGENLACAAHFPLLTPNAQKALFTECIGQTAYSAYFRSFGPQKVAFLDEYMEDAQSAENDPGHSGVHPTQTFAPTAMPEAPESPGVGLDKGYVAPHMEGLGLTPVMTKKIAGLRLQPYQNASVEKALTGYPIIYDGGNGTIHLGDEGWYHANVWENMQSEMQGPYYKGLAKPDDGEMWWYGGNPPEDKEIAQQLSSHFNKPIQYQSDDGDFRDWGHFGKTAGIMRDPNYQFGSGEPPLPLHQQGYLGFQDPLGHDALREVGNKLDTGWSKFTTPEGQPDVERMKAAIVNAFRVVLLSPRKNLRWNAIHYQHIRGVPHSVTDPNTYWDTLEKARVEWNTNRNYSADSHIAYKQYLPKLQNYLWSLHKADQPEAAPSDFHDDALKLMRQMYTEEEERIEADAKGDDAEVIEPKVCRALEKRLKQMLDEKPKPKLDQHDNQLSLMAAMGDELPEGTLQADGLNMLPQEQGVSPGDKYGAFMGSHLKSIAQVSQYADQLLEAALEDVRNHDGAGHHFRQMALRLAENHNIKGIGPKVISFAWLLLQPLTSQLATIDTHMMDVLGHNYEKEMNDRDYFKFERELQAGRDASGYQHLPLGLFQWGMWDNKRTGQGTHQDHSAMRVENPTHHYNVDWEASTGTGEDWVPPSWWQMTQDARDRAGADYDATVAAGYPRNRVPWQDERVEVHAPITASAGRMVVVATIPPQSSRRIKNFVGDLSSQNLLLRIATVDGNDPDIAALVGNLDGMPLEVTASSSINNRIGIHFDSKIFREVVTDLNSKFSDSIHIHEPVLWLEGEAPDVPLPFKFRARVIRAEQLTLFDEPPVPIQHHDLTRGRTYPLGGGAWRGRLPILYDPLREEVHVGSPDYSHMALARGVSPYDYDEDDGLYPRAFKGWVGSNPEVWRGIGHQNYGWYGQFPPDHVDKAIRQHFKLPEDVGGDEWGDFSDWTAKVATIPKVELIRNGGNPGAGSRPFILVGNIVYVGGPGTYHQSIQQYLDQRSLSHGEEEFHGFLTDEGGYYWYNEAPNAAEVVQALNGFFERDHSPVHSEDNSGWGEWLSSKTRGLGSLLRKPKFSDSGVNDPLLVDVATEPMPDPTWADSHCSVCGVKTEHGEKFCHWHQPNLTGSPLDNPSDPVRDLR